MKLRSHKSDCNIHKISIKRKYHRRRKYWESLNELTLLDNINSRFDYIDTLEDIPYARSLLTNFVSKIRANRAAGSKFFPHNWTKLFEPFLRADKTPYSRRFLDAAIYGYETTFRQLPPRNPLPIFNPKTKKDIQEQTRLLHSLI